MMIDWVTARIPLAHERPIHGGRMQCTDAHGEIEYLVHRRLSIPGSHSSTVSIRTLHAGPEGEIEFSGNPVKFLKGHNLYGSTDLSGLMKHALEKIFRHLNLTPTQENWQAILTGQYALTRVDLNEMVAMGSLDEVLAWIRSTSHASRSRHKSGGILKGDTLYFGKHSRRWAMKLYAKGQEITAKGHELPLNLPARGLLTCWAQDKLRWELVLRSPELKKYGLDTAASFSNANHRLLFDSYKARLIIPENQELSPSIVQTLPRPLRAIYALWKSGEDLRRTMAKNTFYRYRRALLAHGIDLSVQPISNVT